MSGLGGSTGIVTGASGFIGRAVLRELPPDAEAYAVYSRDNDFPAWADQCWARIHPHRLDLREQRLADAIPATDWALLAAARVEVARSWEEPVAEIRDAAAVTVNSVRDLKAKRIVHVSSGAVYDGLEGRLSPDLQVFPKVPYGIAKLVAERLLDAYAESPWWNVRFFGAFGPGEPEFKLIRRAVEAFASGATSFALRGDGTNRLDPMHVHDAARSLLRVLEAPCENRTVDLCQGESRSIDEFLRVAFAASHPSGGSAKLSIEHDGVTHEKVLGVPDAAETDARFGLRRMTTPEGLAAYGAQVRARVD